MKIIKVPHPILSQKAKPVKKIDAKIRRIIAQMKKALKMSKIGVGLAAPQVGIPLQIFIASHGSNKSHKTYQVFINPKITYASPTSVLDRPKAPKRKSNLCKKPLEGCLSIPNIWGCVVRASKVKLQYLNEQGKKQNTTFRGFLATIIQHEVDHLNGILFTQRVLTQGEKLYRQVKDPKTGKKVLEEIEI